ncbi:MAG: calcium-binding protein [Rhodobacteraceae bacterium]|nr:calcium-binding protein [Paracoccaceae bacterium]
MTTLTLTNLSDTIGYRLSGFFEINQRDPNLNLQTDFTATSSTVTRMLGPDEVEVSVTGSDFTFFQNPENGRVLWPLTGTVESVTLRVNGEVWMTITGLATDVTDLATFMFGWFSFDRYEAPNGNALFSTLLAGDDTIMGSAGDDRLINGMNGGNDAVYGGDGDDLIWACHGNDSIFGGDGRDFYSLVNSFYDGMAYRGAVVNLATGVATDSWGGTDLIEGIEVVLGSRMADRFIGSAADETLAGLRGNDTISGGDGFDMVTHDGDVFLGGEFGVTVNLARRTATDGWGNTDRLAGIEGAIGTVRDDRFIGDGQDNAFIGGDGTDSFTGGAGQDWVDFDWEFIETGAVVNLGRRSGQVINDGYGNTETLASIENLWGSALADSFTGDRRSNVLVGNDGNDTLSGGGGNDRLIGGLGFDLMTGGAGADVFVFDGVVTFDGVSPGAVWGDRITDFRSGTDKLELDWAMDSEFRFQNGTSAGTTGEAWFYFDGATNRLFWDADGLGGDAAFLVATLTGVTRLAETDFELSP